MAGYYDPYGRSARQPSLADFNRLLQSYRALESKYEKLMAAARQRDQLLQRRQNEFEQLKRNLQQAEVKLAQAESKLENTQNQAAYLTKQRQATQAEIKHLQKSSVEQAPAGVVPEGADGDINWREEFLRLQADMENFKKRQERRFARATTDERRQILNDMLPLADHLELGIEHFENSGSIEEEQILAGYVENLQATLRAFLDTLKRYGVTQIDAIGRPFNPEYHEALGQIPSDSTPAEHVATIIRSGYLDGDQLLRPASVMVSSGRSQP